MTLLKSMDDILIFLRLMRVVLLTSTGPGFQLKEQGPEFLIFMFMQSNKTLFQEENISLLF